MLVNPYLQIGTLLSSSRKEKTPRRRRGAGVFGLQGAGDGQGAGAGRGRPDAGRRVLRIRGGGNRHLSGHGGETAGGRVIGVIRPGSPCGSVEGDGEILQNRVNTSATIAASVSSAASLP